MAELNQIGEDWIFLPKNVGQSLCFGFCRIWCWYKILLNFTLSCMMACVVTESLQCFLVQWRYMTCPSFAISTKMRCCMIMTAFVWRHNAINSQTQWKPTWQRWSRIVIREPGFLWMQAVCSQHRPLAKWRTSVNSYNATYHTVYIGMHI